MIQQNRNKFLVRSAIFLIAFQCLAAAVYSQRIAFLAPETNDLTEVFINTLSDLSREKYKILDRSSSRSAFSSVVYENPFNLSLNEAKNIGQATGADFFLLIRAKTSPRYSSKLKEHFESYAAVYVVSSRTGRLVFWKLLKGEAAESVNSENTLLHSVGTLWDEIAPKISEANEFELKEASGPKPEELPDENSPDSVDLRPPLPYKRFSPSYTQIAGLYGVEATVDILVDIDENGKVLRTEINRWAGFELDESVTRTVTNMNWRPADRNGKRLPMRVLLRYNFKKTEK